MSRRFESGSREREANRSSPTEPRREPPGGLRPRRLRWARAGRAPCSREERNARPGRAREVLVRAAPGSVNQPGRGITQWGRHRLAADSVEALRIIGAYGTVSVGDLTDTFGSVRRMRAAVLDLRQAGLMRVERFRRGQRLVEAATLTRPAKRLLERFVDPRDAADEDAQSYRAGPARRSQVLHDIAVYRAARREAKAIEAASGRIARIRADDDLQRMAWRRMERDRRAGASRRQAQSAAAAHLRLTIHAGRLIFPDLRIEYEPASGNTGPAGREHLDVEVTTPDYREPALRAKSAAGFRVYALQPDGSLSSGTGPSR